MRFRMMNPSQCCEREGEKSVSRTNGYIEDQVLSGGREAYQLLSDDHHAVLDRVRLAVVAVATRNPSADCKD